MERKQFWTILLGLVIVAVIASVVTANINANVVKVPQYKWGTEVYTKAEVDSIVNNLTKEINKKTTYPDVSYSLGLSQDALDISLKDSGWDSDEDGYITGNEVCASKQLRCLAVLQEYIVGYTTYQHDYSNLNLEPLACTDAQPIQSANDTLQNTLNVWCISPYPSSPSGSGGGGGGGSSGGSSGGSGGSSP